MKKEVLLELNKVLSYINNGDNLTKEDMNTIKEDSIKYYNDFVNPGWLDYRKSVSTDAAFIEWTDTLETVNHLDGTQFIDCIGGFGTYICGHRNPEIIKYVHMQMDRYTMPSQELVDPLRGYLAKVLSMITPGDLQYSFFTNCGTEAVEMALKLARLTTGGGYFISTVNGFHGKTFGAVSMTGKGVYRKAFAPLLQQVQHIEYGVAEDLEKAIKIAKKFDSKIVLINVYSVSSFKVTPSQVFNYIVEIRKAGESMLAETKKKLTREEIPVETILKEGHIVEEILKSATEQHIDLIVIGARGLGIMNEILLGSVSHGVILHAPCPIMVVR